MSNNASFMKFNLIHRAVFQNILNTDSRVQQRALSILYQTISDSSKKSSIFNLSTKEIKEFTDILQVPILLPLQSSRHTETVKLAMDCLSVLIENVNDVDSLSKDEEITNTIFLSLFNLLRNPTLATILNKAISNDSSTSLTERVNPITGILEIDTPNNNLKASIFRLIALLADKNDLYANKIIKRALGYISSTKWSNLNSNNIHLLSDFLAVIGTSCLVSDIEDQNDLRKLTNKCLEIASEFDNETVWLRALEILAITGYSMEEYAASRINKNNKQKYRLKARFDLLEDYPPILDIDFTPKLPKKAILNKLNFRLSQSLSTSNLSSQSSLITKSSLSGNSSKSVLSNSSLSSSRQSPSKLSTSSSTITQNSFSIQDSLTPRSSNSNFKKSLDVNLLYSNKIDQKPIQEGHQFTTSLSIYNANKDHSPQTDKDGIYSTSSSQKRFHSAGKRNNNKLPWTKASGASSSNKSSEMSLSSNGSLNLSIYNDKSKLDLNINNNLSNSLQLVGTKQQSKIDLSKNNILQTSPIRSKASLVTRTSSARQHGSSNRIISGHSDSKTSGYSSMYKPDSPTYQSLHLNNSKQPTISSLYKSATLDGQLDLNASINTDVDSDIATIYGNKLNNERSALMSRESGMSMISTTSTLNFDEILGSNSIASSVRIDSNNMQTNGSIMTISPIKANTNSPSLSKNIKKKIENHDVDKQLVGNLINFEGPGQSSKPPIPNSLLSFSRIRSRKASADKGLRSAPSLNEVFNKEKDFNNNDNYTKDFNMNLASTLPASMINNLQHSPRIPITQPILDTNIQDNNISVSKSLRVRATNEKLERKARSAGYGRSTNNINKSLSLKKSRTRSGGHNLPETSNISSMLTKYNQETNWTPLTNPDETLKLCIANLSNSLETKREVETAIISGFVNASLRSNSDENNWIITATSLQSVARLCMFHTELMIPHLMSKINPLVITFLNSIRSAISKHALEAADQMCINCSKYFTENQFNQLIKSLFNIIAGPNKFLKDPVDKVINNAIKHNSPYKLISVINDISKTTKSKTVKEFSAKAFHDLCTHVKPSRMLHDFADKTLPTIALYLTSSQENTRWWGKKILTVFMTIPDFEHVVQQLSTDNKMTSTILHQVETLKNIPLGNRRVASGIRQKHLNQSRVGSSSYRKSDYSENGENGSYHRGFHKNALSSAGSTRTKLSQYSAQSLGSNHGPRGLSQITADNENIKELTESMKTGSLVDRKRAIERFCDKCLSTKQDDKRFIHDNMAKLADAYLDIIKTSNNKVNETALKGLHKCLHQNSSFHSNPAFRDHVPNLIQAIVSHLNSNSRMSSMAKLAGSALDRMIDVLDICIVFPPLANRLNYERPLQVKKVLADKIILLIKGEKGQGQLKNSIIERCALPALYSMAQVPQVRTECQVLAETILEAIGEDRLWQLADVQNKSNVLSKIMSRS